MAFQGKYIENPISGQSIRFIKTSVDTDGMLLEMESMFAPHSTEPLAHYHPHQNESFTILEGKIRVRINGHSRDLAEGEVLNVTRNTIHSMWNAFDAPARVAWTVKPALGTEYFFEIGMGLAKSGKVAKNGMPKPLQAILLLDRFKREYRLSKPPYTIQRLISKIVSPIARAAGYKAVYEEYID